MSRYAFISRRSSWIITYKVESQGRTAQSAAVWLGQPHLGLTESLARDLRNYQGAIRPRGGLAPSRFRRLSHGEHKLLLAQARSYWRSVDSLAFNPLQFDTRARAGVGWYLQDCAGRSLTA